MAVQAFANEKVFISDVLSSESSCLLKDIEGHCTAGSIVNVCVN